MRALRPLIAVCSISAFTACDAHSVRTEFYGKYEFSSAERALIQRIADETAVEARRHLPNLADPLVLRVQSGKDVISEIGATAAVIPPDWVVWTVDADRSEGVSAIAKEHLRGTLFHEFHHLVRGSTRNGLIDQVVTEGLATAFERDFAGVGRPWALYPDDASEWVKELLSQPSTANRDEWLFRHPDGRRWVGLRAGTYLVDQAMKNTGRTSADLVSTSAADLLRMARVDAINKW